MKKISLSEYNPSMGILIDVQHPEDYKLNPTPNSKNVYADKLLMNHKVLLDRHNKYYIICNKGVMLVVLQHRIMNYHLLINI